MDDRDSYAKAIGLRELVLKRIALRAEQSFTDEILHAVEIEQLAEYISQDLWHATLQLLVPGKETVKEYTANSEAVPISWWDHLKQRLGLKFKTREIEKTIVETHYHMCPHLGFGFRGMEQRRMHMNWLEYAGEPQRLRHDVVEYTERRVKEQDDAGK